MLRWISIFGCLLIMMEHPEELGRTRDRLDVHPFFLE